ncbi:tektin-3-like [Nylanderia fulva]|uniref:tektin-3-like n=1 Tax=Nylanderia fulva TaxID=613905 RepID=UPI0010FAD24F|nr:tektin-3-like [Nylanderia fulva]
MANIRSEKRTKAVIYSQLQPWTIDVPSCMEQAADPSVSVKVKEFHKTLRSHPWRPTLGYKILEAVPSSVQPVTNLMMDAYRIPYGMITKPLKFPNLVTGFDRNPLHAARAALYIRYTPYDWMQNQIRLYNEVDSNRYYAEKLCKDSIYLIKQADEKIQKKRMENGQKIEESFTSFPRNKIASELERLITEDDKMQECYRDLQIVIQNLEGQLHITQECLYHREFREDADLVRDEVESALLKEIETVRNCEKKLEPFTNRCIDQLANNRAVQHQLQINIRNEGAVSGSDLCHQTNNFSRNLQYYDKIEKYDPNNTITETESWIKTANNVIKQSETECVKSCQLRSDINNAVNAVSCETYETWENTNKALARRINEILKAKEKLETHLHKIQEEILNIEKSMKLMQKTIVDKDSELKVANTLKTKIYQSPQAKLCKDQFRIIKEAKDIDKMINDMNLKLQQCETQHQQLLCMKSNLKRDLKFKTNALFIDREKCMGIRRSYSISSTVKF